MGTLVQDLRYGIRTLAKNPGFAVVAVLTLALGIGANTAIFSVVDAVLLRPLPYPESDRLFTVYQTLPEAPAQNTGVSYPNYLDWTQRNEAFESIAAVRGNVLALSGLGEPTYIQTGSVTSNYFDVLRVKPLLGRTLQPSDDALDVNPVVVMSESLWRARFGADPALVGRAVTLDQHPITVVGIVPAYFHPSVPDTAAQLWVPLRQDGVFSDMRGRRGGHYLSALGRLKPGVSAAQAQSEMAAMEQRLAEQFPNENNGWGIRIVSLQADMAGNVRTALLVLLGAVGFVFLIACANVASLQLTRATSRRKEIAIRVALGAGRQRLLRQFLTESVLLSLIGGAVGLLLAFEALQGLIAWLPADLPRVSEIHVDARVLAFGLALSVLSGVIFGLAPAWHGTESRLAEALEGARGAGEERTSHRARNIFVVTETALAIVLLIGAGLLIRSFARLQQVNVGFNPAQMLTAQIGLPRAQYAKPEQWISFYRQTLERMNALPGAQEAAVAVPLPLSDSYFNLAFEIEGRPPRAKSDSPTADFVAISPNYFHVMQVPLLRGREFSVADSESRPKVCAISSSLAQQLFPTESALGQRILIGYPASSSREIVGIVGDVKDSGLAARQSAQIYVPFVQNPFWAADIAVRSHGNPSALGGALREQIRAIDPALPVAEVRPMAEVIGSSIAQPRFRTTLLSLFGAVALLLAAIGIYGVLAYTVAQQTREIGIRMALGANPGRVLRLVLGRGLRLAGAGTVIGVLAALLLTQLLNSLLFGVSATDPLTFAAVAGLLLGVALLACYVPARRAMRVDPMVALRYE
jgi:putative ABC transport system permease protein